MAASDSHKCLNMTTSGTIEEVVVDNSTKPVLVLAATIFYLGLATPGYSDIVLGGHESVNGLLTYAGGASPLNLDLLGGMFENGSGPLECFPCVLSLTTGPLQRTDQSNWYFAPGASLVVSGPIISTFDESPVLPSATLISGNLQNLWTFLTPCRMVDTRNRTLMRGAFSGGVSRTVPVRSSSCNVPATVSNPDAGRTRTAFSSTSWRPSS